MATPSVRRKRVKAVQTAKRIKDYRGARERASSQPALFEDQAFRWRFESREHGSRGRLTWSMDYDQYVALMAITALRNELLEALSLLLVEELRDEGFSWDDLALALGMTGEGARKKFSPLLAAREQQQL